MSETKYKCSICGIEKKAVAFLGYRRDTSDYRIYSHCNCCNDSVEWTKMGF